MRDLKMGAACLLAGCVIGSTFSAFAKNSDEQITAYYRNIRLLVNGVEVQTSNEPFIYEGRSFVPLRAVSEALGADVKWDGEKYRVLINTSLDALDITGLKITSGANYSKQPVIMRGVTYPNAYKLEALFTEANVELALNSSYATANLVIGRFDDDFGDVAGTVTFYLDDKEVKTINVMKGNPPESVTLQVKGANTLRIKKKLWNAAVNVSGSVKK